MLDFTQGVHGFLDSQENCRLQGAQRTAATDRQRDCGHGDVAELGTDADIARGQMMSPLLDQLEDRNADLDADNKRLRHQVTHLGGEVRELTDTLDASRTMNSELMSELNRVEPTRAPTAMGLTPSRPPNRSPRATP